ncbi:MAG TPA: DUF885 family protein [Caulobacteraceae bacterium]|jgi:uncharacterized protein (DUF885 family)|nr:DUF885 family protein [Caulobacteraceae bacterium]
MFNRRDLLATASAAFALAPFSGAEAQTAATPEGAKLNSLFDAFFQEGLRHNPENATQLGLDIGANADLRHKLADQSASGIAEARALNLDQLRRLKAINREALSTTEKVNYDTVLYTRESNAAVGRFDFGGANFGPSPYVVSQLTGSYQDVPDFLDTKHRIETAEDADAYLDRLSAFAVQLDQNTERQRHDASLGVIPPDFLIDTTLTQLTATRKPADQTVLVASIARRASAKGLDGRYARDAARIYQEKVVPALDRQIEHTRSLRAGATHDAGVWRLKEGEGYYAAALRYSTTTAMNPDEIHKLGLDQAAEISARLDGLLKAQGMSQGTVGQRIAALYKDPASFFPNTDEGKVQAIAYCNAKLDAIRPRLPRMFKRLPPYKFEVRRVPPATEAGAASAFSQGPALDGSRPGLVWFNLHDSAEWPKWSLPTTVFHEGLPGHQLEGGLALSSKSLPLIRKTSGFSGYAEGWALYAEQLADELGMYDDDPLGRIGYLRFQLFRAGRCVVDTGIHHLRWTREQSIQYFVDLDADAPGFATREVERYCTQPGQACSYKIGHTVWTRARARAQAALGPKYDIKDFHEAGLGCGRVPLDVLDGVIDGYVAGVKA